MGLSSNCGLSAPTRNGNRKCTDRRRRVYQQRKTLRLAAEQPWMVALGASPGRLADDPGKLRSSDVSRDGNYVAAPQLRCFVCPWPAASPQATSRRCSAANPNPTTIQQIHPSGRFRADRVSRMTSMGYDSSVRCRTLSSTRTL